ncbi:MAG: hypothetical protein A3K10_15635 [Bacteroidetes bacterium RIFCSPLOWO2_12_FULL_31_6]|nr:MAG: hypothetical protein A3K10_15635 [Bacteroidetes bacterium RIFCSPLOWO2_12_FULL_31_6]
MSSKLLSLSIFFFTINLTFAQDTIPFVDYDEVIKKCNLLSADKKFHEASQLIGTVNKNDSNYIYSLISKSYYLLNDETGDSIKNNEEIIKITKEGMDEKSISSNYYFFINHYVALVNQKKYKEALGILDKALEKYPTNYDLYYRKGLIYENLEDYTNAVKMYQQSLIFNPFNAKTHLQLGNICYRSNKITEALICFDIYLFLNPDGEGSYQILEAVNTIVTTKVDIEDKIDVIVSKDDDSFDEINLIINNHVSLDKKYKIDNDIKIAVVKQTHLLLEQLKTYEGNDGFFQNRYVPFYNWIRDNGHFNNFIYTICYSSKNEVHKKVIASKLNSVKELIPIAYKKLGECFKNVEMDFNNKKQTVSFYYYNYYLQGIGTYNKNNKMSGYWETYSTKYGFIESKGVLNDEEQKEGEWIWYFENGNIEVLANFKNGKLDGFYQYFFDNGILNYSLSYIEGEPDSEYKLYNKKGALTEHKFFSNGKLNGLYTSYYDVGEDYPEVMIPYKNGVIDGIVTKYYLNGQKSFITTFVDGKKEGIEKEFYKNGTLSSDVEYKDGQLNGYYKTYHPNGQLQSEAQTENGFFNGVKKNYFKDGKLEVECNYYKGDINGVYKEFDIDGKLFYTYDYKKGDVYAYSFFDKEGKLIHSDNKQSGKLNYLGYFPNGNKTSEGIYNYKGGKEGVWKYYNVNGTLNTTSEFKENMLINKTNNYFNDGTIEIYKNYKNDTLQGYYIRKDRFGNRYNEGWYKNGNLHGVWETYYPTNKLKETNYYFNGKLNGEQISYGVDQKITERLYYVNGELINEYYYNQNGEIYDSITTLTSKRDTLYTHYTNNAVKSIFNYSYGYKHGKYIGYFPTGKKKAEGNFVGNKKDGNWVWYFENGKTEVTCTYILGDIEGDKKTYFENGQLKELITYELGEAVGEEKDYNEKGVLLNNFFYHNGVVNGKRNFYSEDGHLQVIRFYHNNELIGYSYLGKNKEEIPMIPIKNETVKITAYFDNGKKSREMELVNGEFENDYNSYYYTGQIYKKQNYKKDAIQGVVNTYYPNGNLLKNETYVNGLLEGKVTEYYENEKIKEETNYSLDVKHGKYTKYNIEGKVIKEENYFNDELIWEN